MRYEIDSIDTAAQHVLEFCEKYNILDFSGEMGAGKTTLISSICEQLEVVDHVSSPTFSLVNEYRTVSDQVIYHFDFYRIEEVSELESIGILEYIESGNLCLLEWSEKMGDYLPDVRACIEISKLGVFERELALKYHG